MEKSKSSGNCVDSGNQRNRKEKLMKAFWGA